MKIISKSIAGLLVVSVIGLYFPNVSFCADSEMHTRTQMKKITQHVPKIMSEPEKDIPLVAAMDSETNGPNWLLIGGAAVLVVGLAAAAGGAGGSDDDGPDSDNGSVVVNW